MWHGKLIADDKQVPETIFYRCLSYANQLLITTEKIETSCTCNTLTGTVYQSYKTFACNKKSSPLAAKKEKILLLKSFWNKCLFINTLSTSSSQQKLVVVFRSEPGKSCFRKKKKQKENFHSKLRELDNIYVILSIVLSKWSRPTNQTSNGNPVYLGQNSSNSRA